MLMKIKNYGLVGYNIMLKPLPEICKRAIIAYWGTQIGTWLITFVIRKVIKLSV